MFFSLPISIHSPHTRGDQGHILSRPSSMRFQSTPLTRGETLPSIHRHDKIRISIHSPHTRGDMTCPRKGVRHDDDFNPLPSHEGRPYTSAPRTRRRTHFNPLPSHEGRRNAVRLLLFQAVYFNPLPSHEGRPSVLKYRWTEKDFNPLPSHEGRLPVCTNVNQLGKISIHSPHTRGDQSADCWLRLLDLFQSTPLTRGETA